MRVKVLNLNHPTHVRATQIARTRFDRAAVPLAYLSHGFEDLERANPVRLQPTNIPSRMSPICSRLS